MYRPEHPNPQMERENWLNLNGEWLFAFDFGKSGFDRRMFLSDKETEKCFDKRINVPFCPESKLSGIEYKDFMNAVWYRRSVSLSKEQLKGRTVIHFGAVDFKSRVFVNGREAGSHIGGYASFSFDITEFVALGENVITVYAEDELRDGKQAAGKQCPFYYSGGCSYTRTTGIWQTVWLEFVPENHVKSIKYFPNIERQCFDVECSVSGKAELKLTAYYEGVECGSVSKEVSGDGNLLALNLSELHLWEAGCGRLYDIVIEFGDDKIKSYAGMRQVKIDGYRFLLNGKSVFLRTVLDQGYYRDGIYTAPTEDDLVKDIKLSMELGFNGARLHQKIFEPRFLYHCDKEGYLVWGEHANWSLDISEPDAFLSYLPEWLEALERDFNHPSIIGWCPLNETFDYKGRRQDNRIVESIYKVTKAADPTRPCIDTSGNYHVLTDIYDLHDYCQDVKEFESHYKDFPQDSTKIETYPERQRYTKGLPVFISEYGGIKWAAADDRSSWGYGQAPESEKEFFERYSGLTAALLNHPYIMGFCYTQLYDVEQEKNGLYDYDRNPKFAAEDIAKINRQPAAIEKE